MTRLHRRLHFLAAIVLAAPALCFADSKKPSRPPVESWPPLPSDLRPLAEQLELGMSRFHERDYEAALKVFEEVRQKHADCWYARLGEGMSLIYLGRSEEAVTALTQVLLAQEDLRCALEYRALALEQVGKPDEAVADLDAVLKSHPGDAWCLERRGWIRMHQDKPEAALADFDAALAANDGAPLSLIGKATVLGQLGRKSEALKVLGTMPDSATLTVSERAWKCVAKHQAGAVDDAERDVKAILDDAPQHDETWHILGWMMRLRHGMKEADQALTAVMEKHPGQAAAHYERGLLRYFDDWSSDKCSGDFREAWKLDPDHFEALFRRLQGDIPAARGYHDSRAFTLASVALRTGRTRWAQASLDKGELNGLQPGLKNWIRFRLEVANGKYQKAVEILEENLGKFPVGIEALDKREEFHDFCASATYRNWLFPPKK